MRRVQAQFLYIFVLCGTVVTAVLAATTVASEKEARTLPLLLCTTVGARHIVFGKALGALYRSWPVWAYLFGHVVLFTALGAIHPAGLVLLAILTIWVTVFLTGTGLYFSTLFRKSSTAVLANLGLGIILWVIVPIVSSGDESLAVGNPMVQTHAIAIGAGLKKFSILASGEPGVVPILAGKYEWPLGTEGFSGTVGILLGSLAIYGGVGVALTLAAARRLRRKAT